MPFRLPLCGWDKTQKKASIKGLIYKKKSKNGEKSRFSLDFPNLFSTMAALNHGMGGLTPVPLVFNPNF